MRKRTIAIILGGLAMIVVCCSIVLSIIYVYGLGTKRGNETYSIACEADEAYESTKTAESTAIAIETAEGTAFTDEETKRKIREYKQKGITYDRETGSWLWDDKQVAMLMDEDGSFYKNGSSEAEKNKIYLIVRRKSDNSISSVKQITLEEVMSEYIIRENKN